MNNKLYVGQMSFETNSNSLTNFFAQAGEVLSAKVIMERDSGRSKGFGFVEMANEKEAQNAINDLNGKTLDGRSISVSLAKPQEKHPARGGGRGPSGYGRGSRSY